MALSGHGEQKRQCDLDSGELNLYSRFTIRHLLDYSKLLAFSVLKFPHIYNRDGILFTGLL